MDAGTFKVTRNAQSSRATVPVTVEVADVNLPSLGSLEKENGHEASRYLATVLAEGVSQGDALESLSRLPKGGIDLFFTSPPYADARAYSRIHPDRYVEWFLPFASAMYEATSTTGSLILNIKNRVAIAGH